MHCECYWVYVRRVPTSTYTATFICVPYRFYSLCCCAAVLLCLCLCSACVSSTLFSLVCILRIIPLKAKCVFWLLVYLAHSRCIDAIWFVVIVLVFRPRYGFTIYIVAQNTAETHENTIRLVCRFRCISVNCFVFSPFCRSSRSLFCPLSRLFGLAHIEYPSHFGLVWQCSSFLPHVSVNWELSKKKERSTLHRSAERMAV